MKIIIKIIWISLLISACGITRAGNPGVEESDDEASETKQQESLTIELNDIKFIHARAAEKKKKQDILLEKDVIPQGLNNELDLLQDKILILKEKQCILNLPDYDAFLIEVQSLEKQGESKKIKDVIEDFKKSLESEEKDFDKCLEDKQENLKEIEKIQEDLLTICTSNDEAPSSADLEAKKLELETVRREISELELELADAGFITKGIIQLKLLSLYEKETKLQEDIQSQTNVDLDSPNTISASQSTECHNFIEVAREKVDKMLEDL